MSHLRFVLVDPRLREAVVAPAHTQTSRYPVVKLGPNRQLAGVGELHTVDKYCTRHSTRQRIRKNTHAPTR